MLNALETIFSSLLLKLCGGEPPHPPGVPVLVPDLLLHLGVGQRLQEGRPRVGVALGGNSIDLKNRPRVELERVPVYTLRRLVIRKVLSKKIWGVPPACLGSR